MLTYVLLFECSFICMRGICHTGLHDRCLVKFYGEVAYLAFVQMSPKAAMLKIVIL